MTQLSLQSHDKNSFNQFRLESDLKYVWKLFCKKNRINQSELFRKWMLSYMQKKGAIRIVEKAVFNPDLINSIEEMPFNVKTETKIEILI